MASQQLK